MSSKGPDKRKYYRYLQSKEWKQKREEAFEFHGRFCRKCGTTKRLEVNHLHYRNIFNEDVANDLEILCHRCHCIHHGMKPGKLRRLSKKQRKKLKWRHPASYPLSMTMDQYRESIIEGRHKSTMMK